MRKTISKVFTMNRKKRMIAEIDHEQCKSEAHVPEGCYEKYFKRPFDMIVAGTALVILSPVIAVTALLVRFKLGTPVLFTQKRPGLHGKVFTIYKFRTMTNDRDESGNLLPDEQRLTEFGRMLRTTSLDELPELINIICGAMSIVGPRPLLEEYLLRYDDRQKHRHDVRPGLTGFAQVCGRNHLSWEERFEDDLKYVSNITFIGDVRIILKTIVTVVKHSGISSETSATMEEFIGDNIIQENNNFGE